MRVVSLLRLPMFTFTAQFRLIHGPEKEDLFYECESDDCLGAGITSFKADAEEIPEEIVEQMRIHVALRHLTPVSC